MEGAWYGEGDVKSGDMKWRDAEEGDTEKRWVWRT